MKKISAILALIAVTAITAAAQPKSAGFRIGSTGSEAAYQHYISKSQFVEGDFGLDFGVTAGNRTGAKFTATYNIIWARPAWTDEGSWAIYAGPGLSLGYVSDRVSYDIENFWIHTSDYGVMFAVAAQAGLEYTFDFPLQLSVDIRPYFGMHINNGVTIDNKIYGSKSGFYNNGMIGFIPSISARYRF